MKHPRLRDRFMQFFLRVGRLFTKATPTPVDDAAVEAVPKARLGLRLAANRAARRERARKSGLLLLMLVALTAASGCVTLDRSVIWLDRECPETEDLPPAEWEEGASQ